MDSDEITREQARAVCEYLHKEHGWTHRGVFSATVSQMQCALIKAFSKPCRYCGMKESEHEGVFRTCKIPARTYESV